MPLDLAFNNLTKNKAYGSRFFEKILKVAVKSLGLTKKSFELSINLVGEGRIKFLNQKYRGKNKPTDVLSFPLLDKVSKRLPANGIIGLGDIFISLPIAKKYADYEGVPLSFKLTFLTVHGFLHLLGYDHEDSKRNAKKMFKLQNKILKAGRQELN